VTRLSRRRRRSQRSDDTDYERARGQKPNFAVAGSKLNSLQLCLCVCRVSRGGICARLAVCAFCSQTLAQLLRAEALSTVEAKLDGHTHSATTQVALRRQWSSSRTCASINNFGPPNTLRLLQTASSSTAKHCPQTASTKPRRKRGQSLARLRRPVSLPLALSSPLACPPFGLSLARSLALLPAANQIIKSRGGRPSAPECCLSTRWAWPACTLSALARPPSERTVCGMALAWRIVAVAQIVY